MDQGESSEHAWLDGLRRGEARAFDAMYAAYRVPIYSFLVRLAGRRDVADDLFQETWLRAARAAPRLREGTHLRAWLFTIARHVHVSYRRWSLLDVSRFVRAQAVPQASAGGAALADAALAASELERAIAGLPAPDREVLLLVAVQGFEQLETAQILGIGHAALRQRVSRARARLARALDAGGAARDADAAKARRPTRRGAT